jgi:hypothetical protein
MDITTTSANRHFTNLMMFWDIAITYTCQGLPLPAVRNWRTTINTIDLILDQCIYSYDTESELDLLRLIALQHLQSAQIAKREYMAS